MVDVIERIRVALTAYFCQQDGESLKGLDVLGIRRRPYSAVVFLRAHTLRNANRLVAKTIIDHPWNKAFTGSRNQAVVEFKALQFLYPKFQEIEGCSVPRPLLVVPEMHTYIMEHVDGGLLGYKLRSARYLGSNRAFAILRNHFYHCGKWLRFLHKFTGTGTAGPESLSGALRHCEHRLELTEKSRKLRGVNGLRERVMSFLNDQVSQLSDARVPIAGRHGDFHSWNILAGPQGITVIDFLDYRQDPLPLDLLKMLVHLEDEKESLTSSARRIEALRESFLLGYGELPWVPTPVVTVCEAMQRAVSLWGSISGPKRKLHHRMEAKFRLKVHLKWLTEEVSRKSLWPSRCSS